jgi:hypothetical protein
MEKRVKVTIDKKGNIQVETLQGFIGQQCHEAVDQVMQVINGSIVESKDKGEFYMSDNPDQFLNLK